MAASVKTSKNGKSTKGDYQKRVSRAALLLKSVSDGTRLQVMVLLRKGGQNVTAICNHVGQSQPAVSHHLALLRHGRLIEPTRNGKNNVYTLTDEGEKIAEVASALVD